jgi:hypothetical protein
LKRPSSGVVHGSSTGRRDRNHRAVSGGATIAPSSKAAARTASPLLLLESGISVGEATTTPPVDPVAVGLVAMT